MSGGDLQDAASVALEGLEVRRSVDHVATITYWSDYQEDRR